MPSWTKRLGILLDSLQFVLGQRCVYVTEDKLLEKSIGYDDTAQRIEMRPLLQKQLRHVFTESLGNPSIITLTELFE